MQSLFAQQALLIATRPHLLSQQLLPSSHSCCSHPAVWAHLWRTSLYDLSPTHLFQSGQTNSALIASENNKENQPGICSVLNGTYGLLIPLFVVDHSRPVSKPAYNFPYSTAFLKSQTYCFLILEYEKRKLNLMVTYCKDTLLPIQYSHNYGFLKVSLQDTLQNFHLNCT